MNNTYSYMRISTKEDRQLQSFNRQIASLKKYADEQNLEYIIEFKEDVSGKNFNDRKEWNKLERILQKGDVIVFKDISRFTREAENGYKKYMELFNKGIELVFIDNQAISTLYIKQLLTSAHELNLVARTTLEITVKLILLVELDRVEQERIILIKRIKDGIKASPKKSGRKHGQLDKMTEALKHDILRYMGDRSIKQVDLMNKHNITRNTLRKYINIIINSGKSLNNNGILQGV